MMRKSIIFAAAFALGIGVAGASFAHHSTNNYYDATRTVDMNVTFKQLKMINPHAIMMFEVVDDKGVATEWSGETHGIGVLARFGWTPKMFKPGEKLVLTGNPPRQDGKHAIHLLKVKQESGKIWTVNNRND